MTDRCNHLISGFLGIWLVENRCYLCRNGRSYRYLTSIISGSPGLRILHTPLFTISTFCGGVQMPIRLPLQVKRSEYGCRRYRYTKEWPSGSHTLDLCHDASYYVLFLTFLDSETPQFRYATALFGTHCRVR
jgi:hypothetical protein